MMRYLLMAAVLPWLCCACAGEKEQELHQSTLETLERVNEKLREVTEDNYRRTSSILQDDSKRKYRPIEPVMDSIILFTRKAISAVGVCDFTMRYEEDFSKEKQLEGLSFLAQILTTTSLRIKHDYQQYLQEQGDSIGLRKEDAEKYLQWMSDNVLDVDSLWINKGYLKLTDADLQQLLAKTKTDLIHRETSLIYLLAQFAGGSSGWGFYLFPQVIPQQNKTVKGRPYNAVIDFAELCSENSRFNLHIYVDGQELKPVKGCYAYYTSAPIYKDEKTIHITGKLKDPVTGEIQVLIEDFPYSIIVD
ncbi:MAG: hypothetical protein ACRBG0_11095 [Lewinella sp.]|uniref:hypothetical protein n=1 Tax=Lewinella sp. TaxID=2004506 RepID=UPI003D6BC217